MRNFYIEIENQGEIRRAKRAERIWFERISGLQPIKRRSFCGTFGAEVSVSRKEI